MFMPSLFFITSFLLLPVATCASNADFINSRGRQSQSVDEEERFSNLNFNAYDGYGAKTIFDSESDLAKESNSFWGRLFIDGFPGENGMQYFRAHFGILPPSLHKVRFVLAQHLDECSDGGRLNEVDENLIDHDTVLVVKRGNCTFGEKAQRAHDAGAGGILFVNNEEGIIHPTAQGKLDLNISAAMISMYNGERMINALKKPQNNFIDGKFVPIACISDDEDYRNYCDPINSNDESYVKDFFQDFFRGTIAIGDNTNFKYDQAQFGARIENKDSYHLIPQSKHGFNSFCDDSYQSEDLVDKAVIVDRGGCHFSKKAENLDLVGAKMMILVNDDDRQFAMGVESDYVASKIKVAAIMVSNETGRELNEIIESSDGDGDIVRIDIHLG